MATGLDPNAARIFEPVEPDRTGRVNRARQLSDRSFA
jgi:hypothetical protein